MDHFFEGLRKNLLYFYGFSEVLFGRVLCVDFCQGKASRTDASVVIIVLEGRS